MGGGDGSPTMPRPLLRRLQQVAAATAGGAGAASSFDLLITGGTVIDPANAVHGEYDIGVRGGVIAAVEPGGGGLASASATESFDASGLLVLPGLVDLHAHGYAKGFADQVSIDFDEACLTRCTTTVVDAGTAGANTFAG